MLKKKELKMFDYGKEIIENIDLEKEINDSNFIPSLIKISEIEKNVLKIIIEDISNVHYTDEDDDDWSYDEVYVNSSKIYYLEDIFKSEKSLEQILMIYKKIKGSLNLYPRWYRKEKDPKYGQIYSLYIDLHSSYSNYTKEGDDIFQLFYEALSYKKTGIMIDTECSFSCGHSDHMKHGIYCNDIPTCSFETHWKKVSIKEFIHKLLEMYKNGQVHFLKEFDKSEFLFEKKEEIHSEEICSECSYFYDDKWNYREVEKVDNLFNSMILSHGLSAYNKVRDVDDLMDRLDNITNNLSNRKEVQICCTNKAQRIGPLGVYIKGHNNYVSNIDLTSYIDERGNRIFDLKKNRAKGIVHSLDEYSLEKWDHTEHVVSDFTVVGVWVKQWALDSIDGLKESIDKFLHDKNLIYHVVKERRNK